jgi:ribosomal protein L11 methyltransferase
MYLWRRLATPRWLLDYEKTVRARAGRRLVLVERPGRKAVALELVCRSEREARRFAHDFGGRIETLPGDWLTRYTRAERRPPLCIGRRLLIGNAESTVPSRRSPRGGASHLVIPAGVAFGTGEHATTAMSLRLLEGITRSLKGEWSFADLGTGSGILALAARCFGASHVVGVDNDPRAISTARANARRNGVSRARFQIADVRRWRPARKIEVVGANLYSELLIEALPRLSRYLAANGRVILSGIMRTQEKEVLKALKANGIRVREIRRRGKWIAILAGSGPREGKAGSQKPS